jgi:hypothetical protein
MMTKNEALHKIEEHTSRLKNLIERAIAEKRRLDEVERDTFVELMDMGLMVLTAFLAESGEGDEGEHVEHQGKQSRRLPEKHKRTYRSIYGALEIQRYVYGTREGQAIEHVPLDAQLGLPAGEVSYVLEDWLERLCLTEAFRESVNSLVALLGVRAKVSVDTAEEHSKQMARHAGSYRASQAMPPAREEGEFLVVTADGKGVPMRRPVNSATQDCTSRHRRRKGEKAHKKQMAYVGAVYTIDPFRRTADDILDDLIHKKHAKDRPSPKHKHVWAEMTLPGDDEGTALAPHGPSYLFAELAVECHDRDPKKEKPLICLLDGERQFWDLQNDWLTRAVQVLDIFHATERLWTLAYCFHVDGSLEAKQWVERYLRMLLEGRVGTVIRSFRQFVGRLSGEKRKRMLETITYYENNRKRMRYDQYLAAGYPIGSGVAEGACRYVVKDRMERTGMRWCLEGAQPMLRLRALYANGDWQAFVEHRIEEEQKALYAQAA